MLLHWATLLLPCVLVTATGFVLYFKSSSPSQISYHIEFDNFRRFAGPDCRSGMNKQFSPQVSNPMYADFTIEKKLIKHPLLHVYKYYVADSILEFARGLS